MAEMMKLFAFLREWILEREDRHGLQNILDVIEMLLNIPLNTPLAKVIDLLEPIRVLVSSWKKIEFGLWPALLDEVQDQYEISAGKLWFALYSVLQHRRSADIHWT